MPTYNSPGVYVEEIATLPPSVAEVSTAVPAFIGVTKKTPAAKLNVPVRIDSLMEYIDMFGTAENYNYQFDITKDANKIVTAVTNTSAVSQNTYNLYYALRMFYDNGGGSCWIVSVGNTLTDDIAPYKSALDALDGVDEPTLLVAPHASINLTLTNYNTLCQSMLTHAAKLRDRFAILDVPTAETKTGATDVVNSFRSAVVNDLAYGAAYTPFLHTSMAYIYDEAASVKVKTIQSPTDPSAQTDLEGLNNVASVSQVPLKDFKVGTSLNINLPEKLEYYPSDNDNEATITVEGLSSVSISAKVSSYNKDTGATIILPSKVSTGSGSVSLDSPRTISIKVSGKKASAKNIESDYVALSKIATTDTSAHQAVKSFLKTMPTVIAPPSAAIAGIYARVDRDRGVWKAPANVGVAGVIGPLRNIDNAEQDNLNVDSTGKSINVIRSFAGRGTLVWGARTLAGNDNEWRYIPVRRLFITIEESIQKATAFAVFEPNDISTWLKVKAMIESYLYGLWQQGALAGSTPEGAYFVKVGLDKTMTSQDILEGRMIVEVGIAAVRPAEFIIIRFSHKLQTI